MLEQFLMKYFWHSCKIYLKYNLYLIFYLGGMVFIAIPFLTYDGPPETDGNLNI